VPNPIEGILAPVFNSKKLTASDIFSQLREWSLATDRRNDVQSSLNRKFWGTSEWRSSWWKILVL